MIRKAALTVSIAGVIALALVAIFAITGASAESRNPAPADLAQANNAAPAFHLNGAVSTDGMPADCDMENMPENCDMADMPEACQEMMAAGCMGSAGMMGMHSQMMGMHGHMDNMMGQHGAAMQGMAGCPMLGHHADDEPGNPAQ